jgi:hypothetical protein
MYVRGISIPQGVCKDQKKREKEQEHLSVYWVIRKYILFFNKLSVYFEAIFVYPWQKGR